MSSKRIIVHVGLGDAPPGFNMTDAEIREKVQQGADNASSKFKNLEVETTFIMSADLRKDPAKALESFRGKIARLKPYGVIVGGGVRMNAQLTPFLESILEAVRIDGGGDVRLGFQCAPGDILEVCERCFI